jgi:hypothetical protein
LHDDAGTQAMRGLIVNNEQAGRGMRGHDEVTSR